MSYTVGIDVGGTKTAFGLYGDEGNLLARHQSASSPDLSFEEMLEGLFSDFSALLALSGVRCEEVRGTGLGLPGHVLSEKGLLLTAPNLPNWVGKNVRDAASKRFSVPCAVDNDANVAALAEYRLGAGRGSRNMAYVTISTGVGCGLVLDGKLFRGSYCAAGELGHLFVTDSGLIRCGCGRTSCVEAMSSGTGMANYARLRISEGAISILPEIAGGAQNITARHVAEALSLGDNLAEEVVVRAAEGLARAFYNIYQLVNCDTIVYGGGVSRMGPSLFDRVSDRFYELIPMAREYPMRFTPAALGDEAGIAGAALLI